MVQETIYLSFLRFGMEETLMLGMARFLLSVCTRSDDDFGGRAFSHGKVGWKLYIVARLCQEKII
jgi:hypothetical protein